MEREKDGLFFSTKSQAALSAKVFEAQYATAPSVSWLAAVSHVTGFQSFSVYCSVSRSQLTSSGQNSEYRECFMRGKSGENFSGTYPKNPETV